MAMGTPQHTAGAGSWETFRESPVASSIEAAAMAEQHRS
jgi:hypothetical protein